MLFKEEQYLRKAILGKLAIGIQSLLVVGLLVVVVVLGPKNNHEATPILLPMCVLLLLLVWILWKSKLWVRIDDRKIEYRYTPFNWKVKKLKWDDVEKAEIREYSPVGEVGGYGYRKHPFKKKTYLNVSGKIGLDLKLKNGRTLLIGTQKGDELQSFLTKLEEKKIG